MFDPKRMTSKGYTLWLVPKGELSNKFSTLIRKLAEEYDGPVFIPHVTLLGDIELSEEEMAKRTLKLTKNQKSFTVTMQQIAYEDFFFRTLIVKAKVTRPLQSLHNLAKKIFEKDIPSFIPHLSILYGEYPVETKKKIISEIGKDQTAQFRVKSVFLIKGGEVKDWKIIKEFPFS